MLQHYAKPEKPDAEGHVLYGSMGRKRPREVNPQKQKVDEGLPGARGGATGTDLQQVQGFFLG